MLSTNLVYFKVNWLIAMNWKWCKLPEYPKKENTKYKVANMIHISQLCDDLPGHFGVVAIRKETLLSEKSSISWILSWNYFLCKEKCCYHCNVEI